MGDDLEFGGHKLYFIKTLKVLTAFKVHDTKFLIFFCRIIKFG